MASKLISDIEIKLYTEIISVGTAKLISKIISYNPEELAKRISKEYTFGLAFTAMTNSIRDTKATDKFRQHHIKGKLPEFIREIRGEELSNVFASLNRLGILERSIQPKSRKKLGRKSVNDNQTEQVPGQRKFHKITELDNEIKNVLNNRKAVNQIYMLLLYSALIFRLMKHGKLISLYVMKINKFNKDKAFRVCKSVFPIDYRQREFQEDFKMVSSINTSGHVKKLLEASANHWAYLYVKNHKAKDYYDVFYNGAYYFFV